MESNRFLLFQAGICGSILTSLLWTLLLVTVIDPSIRQQQERQQTIDTDAWLEGYVASEFETGMQKNPYKIEVGVEESKQLRVVKYRSWQEGYLAQRFERDVK